ncbi:putative WD-40 repeat-containing protein [Neospora caninum Liverpool]|uniref:Putative WD-40 repeat-containing protein n=1 Tax=Neospora caninum (strain Liverpool) TaxID=572307 RepID=F0VHD6_NEOCL|nr:putative WD-40 repeat-containing protein [Neospora caninum Liverpool]CBZ53130.1 putative WD-40 repeat-containing protein [Neospora caninum Liverpool]CEL67118.1 TPA: WD-40 repeat-containing protein, putative [Neospora caninum Liverpool]|eukprot:XP_003883162.1 putative WD-40 repeat-containing protein [Neospora caninum Liverpool]
MSFAPAGGGRPFAVPVVYRPPTPVRNVPSPPSSTPPVPPAEPPHAPVGGHLSGSAPSSFPSVPQPRPPLTGARAPVSFPDGCNSTPRPPRSPTHHPVRPTQAQAHALPSSGAVSSLCAVDCSTPQDASSQLGKAYGLEHGETASRPMKVEEAVQNSPVPLGCAAQPEEGSEDEERDASDRERPSEFPEPELLRTFRDKCSPINGVAFSPDMQCMYTSSDDCSLHIYSLQKGVCTRVLHANKYGVHSIRILPHSLVNNTSSTSASSPSSGGPGTHGIQPHLQPPPGGAAGVTCLCLCATRASAVPAASANATGNSRASASGSVAKAPVGKGKPGEEGPEVARAVAPGSTAFAVRLWDLAENRYLRTFPLNGRVCRGNGLCLHPQRNIFACCSEDATVRLFALDKEQPIWSRTVRTSTPLAAFDNEGLVLAVYEGEGIVTFFDSKHPHLPFLRFSIATSLRRGVGRGSCGASGTEASTVCPRCSLPVKVGQAKVEGGSEPGTDSQKTPGCCRCNEHVERGRPLSQERESAFEQATSLLFSPDDSEIVVGTSDERLLFFDTTTGELLRILSARKRGLPRMRAGSLAPETAEMDEGRTARGVRGECTEERGAEDDAHSGCTSEPARGGCWATQSRALREIVRNHLSAHVASQCSGKRRRDGNGGAERDRKRTRLSLEREGKPESGRSTGPCSGSSSASASSSRPASTYSKSLFSHSDASGSRGDASSLFNISPPPFGCSSSCPDCSSGASSSPLPGEARSRPVFVPAFSPCGRFLAVGSTDRHVHIFDLHANRGRGREVFALGRCESDPLFVAFNSKFDVFLTAGLNASLWSHSFCRKLPPSLTCG